MMWMPTAVRGSGSLARPRFAEDHEPSCYANPQPNGVPFGAPQQHLARAFDNARGVHDPPARRRHDKPGNVVFLKSEPAPRPLVAVAKKLVAPSHNVVRKEF